MLPYRKHPTRQPPCFQTCGAKNVADIEVYLNQAAAKMDFRCVRRFVSPYVVLGLFVQLWTAPTET